MILLLAACSGDDAGTGASSFRSWIGAPGTVIELQEPREPVDTASGDTGATDSGAVAESRWLGIAADAWTLRSGSDFDAGAPVGEWPVTYDGGLVVGGTVFLPENVSSVDSYQTWYGTFPDATTVQVEEGEWAGTHVFAKGVGPVSLTIAGVVWELVWYEAGEEP